MDLLHLFQIKDCKKCANPYQLGVKLTKDYESPQVDTTLYQQLVGSLIYLTHSRLDIYFVVSVKGKNMPERFDPSYLLEIDILEIIHKHSENNIQHNMCTIFFTMETLNREIQQTKELNCISRFYYIYN
jgi:hypothetical protein